MVCGSVHGAFEKYGFGGITMVFHTSYHTILYHFTLPTHAGVHVTYLRINRTRRLGRQQQAGRAGRQGQAEQFITQQYDVRGGCVWLGKVPGEGGGVGVLSSPSVVFSDSKDTELRTLEMTLPLCHVS